MPIWQSCQSDRFAKSWLWNSYSGKEGGFRVGGGVASFLLKHLLPEAPASCSTLRSRNSKLNLAVADKCWTGMPAADRDSQTTFSWIEDKTWRNDSGLKPSIFTQFVLKCFQFVWACQQSFNISLCCVINIFPTDHYKMLHRRVCWVSYTSSPQIFVSPLCHLLVGM